MSGSLMKLVVAVDKQHISLGNFLCFLARM